MGGHHEKALSSTGSLVKESKLHTLNSLNSTVGNAGASITNNHPKISRAHTHGVPKSDSKVITPGLSQSGQLASRVVPYEGSPGHGSPPGSPKNVDRRRVVLEHGRSSKNMLGAGASTSFAVSSFDDPAASGSTPNASVPNSPAKPGGGLKKMDTRSRLERAGTSKLGGGSTVMDAAASIKHSSPGSSVKALNLSPNASVKSPPVSPRHRVLERRVSVTEGKKKSLRPTFLQRVLHFIFGNFVTVINVPLDSEAQRLVDEVQMTSRQVFKLKLLFDHIDAGKSGTVDASEFLEALEINKTAFTDTVFLAKGLNPKVPIEFSPLLVLIIEYALLSKEGILQFCFNIYDQDRSGFIDETEFSALMKVVNEETALFPGNFERALQEFDANSDGLIDLREFAELNKRYPLVLYPAFHLQDNIQRACLGQKAWTDMSMGLNRKRIIEEYKLTHGGMEPTPADLQRMMQHHRRT